MEKPIKCDLRVKCIAHLLVLGLSATNTAKAIPVILKKFAN